MCFASNAHRLSAMTSLIGSPALSLEWSSSRLMVATCPLPSVAYGCGRLVMGRPGLVVAPWLSWCGSRRKPTSQETRDGGHHRVGHQGHEHEGKDQGA